MNINRQVDIAYTNSIYRILYSTLEAANLKMSWRHLPGELRHMILREIALGGPITRRALSSFAAVSREWQQVFETITFSEVNVTDNDLDEFQRIVNRRHSNGLSQPPIAAIRLRVFLLPYPHYPRENRNSACLDCRQPENDQEAAQNDIIFTNALWKLLETLALMGGDSSDPDVSDSDGCELELSAHSPSDCKHYFKWYHVQENYPHQGTLSEQTEWLRQWYEDQILEPVDDPAHGYGPDRFSWVRNHLRASGADEYRNFRIAQRLVRPLRLNFRDIALRHGTQAGLRLPVANIVTYLVMRRQHFRDISTADLGKLLDSLPSLRRLRRENWRLIRQQDRTIDDRRYAPPLAGTHSASDADYLLTRLPPRLRNLYLFEDFEAQLNGREDALRPRISGIQVLPSLAVSTPNLSHLGVGFLTEAIDCFGLRDYYLSDSDIPDHATYCFEQLTCVVLTAQEHLHPFQTSWKKPNALLRAAAAVALKMPQLKIMELWNLARPEGWIMGVADGQDRTINVAHGQACIFRYNAADAPDSRRCEITWQSNWEKDLVIEDRVMAAWQRVAETNVPDHHGEISFARHRLSNGHGPSFLRYGQVVRRLWLGSFVLHSTSAMQAEFESLRSPERLWWSH